MKCSQSKQNLKYPVNYKKIRMIDLKLMNAEIHPCEHKFKSKHLR